MLVLSLSFGLIAAFLIYAVWVEYKNLNPDKESAEVWMNPATGSIYLYHAKEQMLEYHNGVKIRVVGFGKNKEAILEKIGEL
jgi:hypothetical protein